MQEWSWEISANEFLDKIINGSREKQIKPGVYMFPPHTVAEQQNTAQAVCRTSHNLTAEREVTNNPPNQTAYSKLKNLRSWVAVGAMVHQAW